MVDSCPELTGAEIKNICNEGYLLALRQGKTVTDLIDLQKAVERVLGGYERASAIFQEPEKYRLAVRAVAYGLINARCKVARKVSSISIYPRSKADVDEDSRLLSKSRNLLIEEMCLCLAGPIAETLFNGKIDNISWSPPANWLSEAKKAQKLASVYVQAFSNGKFEAIDSSTINDLVGQSSFSAPNDIQSFLNTQSERVRKTLLQYSQKIKEIVANLVTQNILPISVFDFLKDVPLQDDSF